MAPFVQLPWEVLNSNAHIELKHSAKGLLPHLYGKARYDYKNPDRYVDVFDFSYKEAKKFGYSSSTYYDGVKQLRANGFIDKVRQGYSHGENKATNLYRISDRWKKFDTDEFVKSDQEALNEYTQKQALTG